MKVNVRFAGTMQNLAERHELWVDLPSNSTVQEMMDALQSALPAAFNSYILQPLMKNKQRAAAILVINDKQFVEDDMLARPLKDGDLIVFLPPMEGG